MQVEFTRSEADNAIECAKEIMEKMPKKKFHDLFGEFNDLFLFLEAAKTAAPEQPIIKVKKVKK